MREIDEAVGRLRFHVRESFADGDRRFTPDEAALSRLESEIGADLPPQFRYFLSRYGGGVIQDAVVHTAVEHEHLMSVEGLHTSLDVFGFYRPARSPEALPQNVSDVRVALSLAAETLPRGLVPFAALYGKYFFCVSCASESFGKVYVKAPEEFDDDDPADFLFPQAESLLDFLRGLRCLSEAEAVEWDAHCQRTGRYPVPLWTDDFEPSD